jgi:paraquat-inducible protein B
MSKQANKTVIGIFVVGAIALVVVAIVVLGSGKFFKKTLKTVCYFEGSVGGLNIGAPVVFRGVKIGSVTRVVLSLDPSKLIFTIPVYIEIEPDKLTVTGPRPKKIGQNLPALIDKGLRATLEMQSLVTGQMQVGLDLYPDKPAKFAEFKVDTETPEIPTIPTPMQELTKKIEKIPIDKIFEKLSSALEGIDKLVKSPEIPEAIRSVNLALGDVRKLVQNVDGQVGPLASNLNDTVQDVRKLVQNADGKVTGLASSLDETVKEVRGVVKRVDNGIDPLVAGIEKTIKSAEATLTAAQKTVQEIQTSTGENSTLGYELNKTLEETTALLRSIRLLADYLQRHPESVIWGK